MSNNIFTVYGEVPELVEKKTKEIVNDYLGQKIDDFNYVKYNLYESDLTPIIEETLTMPFFSNKKAIVVKNSYVFTGEKFSKDLNHNSDELIKFLEKYDGRVYHFTMHTLGLFYATKYSKIWKNVASNSSITVADLKEFLKKLKDMI